MMELYTVNTLVYRGTETEQNDIIVWFTVPKEWAEKWCKKNEFKSLKEFDTEYIWDDSFEMYISAQEDGVILHAEEE